MSSVQEEHTEPWPPGRRRTFAQVPRQRRPGRVGAHCDRCEEDLDTPDNPAGHELVAGFETHHASHERRATTDSAPGEDRRRLRQIH